MGARPCPPRMTGALYCLGVSERLPGQAGNPVGMVSLSPSSSGWGFWKEGPSHAGGQETSVCGGKMGAAGPGLGAPSTLPTKPRPRHNADLTGWPEGDRRGDV